MTSWMTSWFFEKKINGQDELYLQHFTPILKLQQIELRHTVCQSSHTQATQKLQAEDEGMQPCVHVGERCERV